MRNNKMNIEKRQQLESELVTQRVRVWFTEKHEVTKQNNDTFLKVSSLTDKEISQIKSSLNWGLNSGLTSDSEGRNVFLNWES